MGEILKMNTIHDYQEGTLVLSHPVKSWGMMIMELGYR